MNLHITTATHTAANATQYAVDTLRRNALNTMHESRKTMACVNESAEMAKLLCRSINGQSITRPQTMRHLGSSMTDTAPRSVETTSISASAQ